MSLASGILGHVKLIIFNSYAFVFKKIYHICYESAVEQQPVFRNLGSDTYYGGKITLRGKEKIKKQKWWKRSIQYTNQKVRYDLAVSK